MTWRGRLWTGLAMGVAAALAGCVFSQPDGHPPPRVTVEIGCGSESAEPTQVFVGETMLVTRHPDDPCDGFALGPTQLFTLHSGYFGPSGVGTYAEVAADGSFSFELQVPADMRLGIAVVEAVPAVDPCPDDDTLECLPPSALVVVSHRPAALRTVHVVSTGVRPPPLPAEWAHAYAQPGPAPNQLTVVLFGNSCEVIPTAFVATAPRDSLELVSRQPMAEACRDVLTPWTSIIDVPARYAGFRAVKVDNVPAEFLPRSLD